MTEIEKDVGGWLYNEVNLYPPKECQFFACRSIKLPEELTFLVTDMDECMAGEVEHWDSSTSARKIGPIILHIFEI